MKALYSALLWLALPFALARLYWRSRRQPGYRHHVTERLGSVPRLPEGPVIWIHAVSLGETRAAEPLVKWLRREAPSATLLLTHTTPTGRDAGEKLFGESVRQAWLPWDLPFAMQRFFSRTQPSLGLIMETEVWPNLLATAERAGVPVYLVNARLSERSARRYEWAGRLAREAMGRFAGVAAQTEADAARVRALGARAVTVTGNLKFDLAVPDDLGAQADRLRAWAGPQRCVWVVGSTREGEEALVVQAVERAPLPPDVLVVVVPRHPQRFDEVATLLQRAGSPAARRSAGGPVPTSARFALGDTLGEMLAYYAAADIVFVGGSLLPHGGQNLIEACATGRPVLIGPHTFNFSAAAEEAVGLGAARRVADATQLVGTALALSADREQRTAMGHAAKAFAEKNRGAMDRLGRWLTPALAAIRDRGRDLRARGPTP